MPLYHHNITNSQPIDSSPINPTSDNYKGWTMSTNSVRFDWSGRDAYCAFNDTGWGSDDGTDYWVKWTNGHPLVIRKYSLIPTYQGGAYGSTGWQLQGSNDNSNWTTIHSHTSEDPYSAEAIIEFSNSTPFLYHRLLITETKTHAFLENVKCYSGEQKYESTGFDELGVPVEYDSAIAAQCPVLSLASPVIRNKGEWTYISDYQYRDPKNQWEIYSQNSPEGSYTIFHAFAVESKKEVPRDDRYLSSSPRVVTWRNLKKKVLIKRYQIGTGGQSGYTSRCIRSFELQGSDNGSDWQTIDTRSDIFGQSAPERNTFVYFQIANTTPFYYHRLYATNVYGGDYYRVADILAFG